MSGVFRGQLAEQERLGREEKEEAEGRLQDLASALGGQDRRLDKGGYGG